MSIPLGGGMFLIDTDPTVGRERAAIAREVADMLQIACGRRIVERRIEGGRDGYYVINALAATALMVVSDLVTGSRDSREDRIALFLKLVDALCAHLTIASRETDVLFPPEVDPK